MPHPKKYSQESLQLRNIPLYLLRHLLRNVFKETYLVTYMLLLSARQLEFTSHGCRFRPTTAATGLKFIDFVFLRRQFLIHSAEMVAERS